MRKKYYAIGTDGMLNRIKSAFSNIGEHVVFGDDIGSLSHKFTGGSVALFGDAKKFSSSEICAVVGECEILSPSRWVLNIWEEYDDIILKPVALRLDASTVCQLRCRDCYMRKWNSGTVGAGFLEFKNFKNLVDANPNIKEIELSNSGEIFLNPNIKDIIMYAREKGVILTAHNGNNFNNISEDVLEAIVSSGIFKNIAISIDGITQESYEQYRCGGNLENVLSNINKLNRMKEKYNTEKPDLVLSFILFEHNEADLPYVADMARKYGMTTYYKVDWSGKYQPKDVEMVKRITGFDFQQKSKAFDLNSSNNNVFCQQMFFAPQINWDGRLLGCCTIFTKDWGVNVFEEGLEYSMNSGKYKNMLTMMLGGEKITGDLPCVGCRRYSAFESGKYIFG